MSIASSSIRITLATSLAILFSCCDKPSHPENSILGTWRCFEEGSRYGYRQYEVFIDYQTADSSVIRLNNFYNLGVAFEAYASVSDTLLTLVGSNNFDGLTGTGHVMRDFSAIYWEFSYSGTSQSDPFVEAAFRRY